MPHYGIQPPPKEAWLNTRPGLMSISQFSVTRRMHQAQEQLSQKPQPSLADTATEELLDEEGFPLDPLDGLTEQERLQQFLMGNITLAELEEISHEEVYSLAELGNNFYKQGHYAKARAIFEGLVVMEPTDSWLHLCLGLCFLQEDNDYRAMLELDRAIFLNQNLIQARLERAELLMKHSELELAVQDLVAAVELDPDDEDPYALRAKILLGVLEQLADESGGEEETALETAF